MAGIFRDSVDHYKGNWTKFGVVNGDILIKWDDMALGFTGDAISTSPTSIVGSSLTIPGRTGPQCMGFHTGTSGPNFAIVTKLVPSFAHYTAGCAIYLAALPFAATPSIPVIRFRGPSGNVTELAVNQFGGLDIYEGPSNLILVSSVNGVFTAGNWFYIELSITDNGMGVTTIVGTCNGVTVANGSYFNSGNVYDIAAIDFGPIGRISDVFLDDIYINDDQNDPFLVVQGLTTPIWLKGLMGDIRVNDLLPNSDGFYQMWTPLVAGPHYQMINEQYFDGDTTYNSSSTASDIDTYGFPHASLPTGGFITDVQAIAVARKEDAGTRILGHLHRESATDVSSPFGFPLTESYFSRRYIWSIDLVTKVPWTTTSFDASEFGPIMDN